MPPMRRETTGPRMVVVSDAMFLNAAFGFHVPGRIREAVRVLLEMQRGDDWHGSGCVRVRMIQRGPRAGFAIEDAEAIELIEYEAKLFDREKIVGHHMFPGSHVPPTIVQADIGPVRRVLDPVASPIAATYERREFDWVGDREAPGGVPTFLYERRR